MLAWPIRFSVARSPTTKERDVDGTMDPINGSCLKRRAADSTNLMRTRYWMNNGIPAVLAVGGDNCPEFANSRGGTATLEHICGLFGYNVSAYSVRNLDELRRTIRFVGAVGRLPQFEANPLLVHVSVNGDADGMGIGRDRAAWDKFIPMILATVRDLKACSRPITVALSAPGANEEHLAELLSRHGDSATHPPDHMFLFVDRPPRRADTVFAWTHFYGEAAEMDFTAHSIADQPNAQRLRIRLRRLGMGKFRYFQW